MSAARQEQSVVLRRFQLEGEAATIGRARSARVATAASLEEEMLAAAPVLARDEAYQEGMRQGREDGLRAGREEGQAQGRIEAAQSAQVALAVAIARATEPLQERERRLAGLAAHLDAALADLLRAGEDEMVALCYEVICHVLGRELLTAEGLRAQVRTLLARAKERGALAVHLHPQDVQLLKSARPAGQDESLGWVADPQVALGGCIVRAEGGALDGRLENLLDELKATLLASRQEEPR